MVCIYCKSKTKVNNSRHQKRLNQVWRRRQCLKCQAIVTTNESIILEGTILVVAGDDSELFSRDKLFLSLYNALKHRKTAIEDANALTETVISNITLLADNPKITKNSITTAVLRVLANFDTAAETSYRAFHQS